jgi:hypothetical protein
MLELNEGGNKEFTAYLSSASSLEDLTSGKRVVIRGTVHRSSETTFALVTQTQILELPVAAVDKFKVIGNGVHPEAELSVTAEALGAARTINPKQVVTDTQTLFHSDRKLAIKDVHTDPISDRKHVFKDLHKDPIQDPITHIGDVGGTWQEQTFDPSQGINPDPVLTPFVIATPHQAPTQLLNLQAGVSPASRASAFKSLQAETVKQVAHDNTLKEVIHDTHKEVVFDTRKELVFDTHKELIETQVEGGGTWQEGPHIPGGFPGMPGF